MASRRWLSVVAPLLGLFALNVAFRLPMLLNAAAVHSDAAIVGLQARHVLEGEWSRFIWHAGYQSSFDADVIAGLFRVLGPTPLALMLGPLLGHLLLTAAVYLTGRQLVGAWQSFLVALPIVFTPTSINSVVSYAPRQWCVSVMFFGICLIALRGGGWVAPVRTGVGVLLGFVSLALDLFGVLFFPSLVLLTVAAAFDAPRTVRSVATRLAGGATGGAAGYALFKFMRTGADAVGSVDKTAVTFQRFDFNWALLKDTCLPFTLGAKVWVPGPNLWPDLWHGPTVIEWLQTAAGYSLLVMALVGCLLVFSRRLDWPVKRTGLYGASVMAATICAFLVSPEPTDMWSARYLAPLIWVAPFALMPLAAVLRVRGLAVVLVPYLCAAAFGGWLGYGQFVDGLKPVVTARGAATEERAVVDFLRKRGVEAAAAQYWLAYRLSFLWEEQPVVVPLSAGEDRYPPHQQRFASARVVAYVFHPSAPRASPAEVLPWLAAQPGRVESVSIADFTILVHDRGATP